MATKKKTSKKTAKKKSTRRTRADAIGEEVAAVQRELRASTIEPPPHVDLPPEARPFWDDITSARARQTWNRSDLTKAANLARTRADIERVQKTLHIEGDTKFNLRGTEIVNPLHSLLETLTRRDVLLSKALHVHASATQGRADRGVGEKTKAETGAKKAAEVVEGDEDSYLGTPDNSQVH